MTKKGQGSSATSPPRRERGGRGKIAKADSAAKEKPSSGTGSLLCAEHGFVIEFLCVFRSCLKEMCSHCIISHKDHISEVEPIRRVMSRELDCVGETSAQSVKELIVHSQTASLAQVEKLGGSLREVLRLKLDSLREKVIVEDELFKAYLSRCEEAKELWPAEGVRRVGRDFLQRLKAVLQTRRCLRPNQLVIDGAHIEREMGRMFARQVCFLPQGVPLNSTQPGVEKILHWFEWDKRDLHLYNVTEYSYRVVRLAIYFKIPSYSRSLLSPDGRLYLIGGEDAESGPRRELYSLALSALATDCTLHSKAPMLSKRYDFAVCFFSNFIFVVAGKNGFSEVTDEVEKYDIARDRWIPCAPILRKRYAASAAVQAEVGKIYVFGGRSDDTTQIMAEVEEYDVASDAWSVLKLSPHTLWVPVEVCACIQTAMDRILIFGGSDSTNEDSNAAYVFRPSTRVFEKASPLRKGHVFVNAPFLHGNQVFAVGNEYYVKSRKIQRFDLDRGEWDLLF